MIKRDWTVIDHAFAFSEDFWPTIFWEQHIFKDDWNTIVSDPVRKKEYAEKMSAALLGWKNSCDAAPKEWQMQNLGEDDGEIFDCASALTILARCTTEELWKPI